MNDPFADFVFLSILLRPVNCDQNLGNTARREVGLQLATFPRQTGIATLQCQLVCVCVYVVSHSFFFFSAFRVKNQLYDFAFFGKRFQRMHFCVKRLLFPYEITLPLIVPVKPWSTTVSNNSMAP